MNPELADVRGWVSDHLGIFLEREDRFDAIVESRMRANGLDDANAYLRRLQSLEADRELAMLADALTVGETYFFRGMPKLELLVRDVLPQRLRARSSGPVRVLSIGCASGEEVYSIAMLIREHLPSAMRRIEITGIDVSPAAIRKARRAEYTEWSMRATSIEKRTRWFIDTDDGVRLCDEIREMVSFRRENLLAPEALSFPAGSVDVIFCRNVLIYMTSSAIAVAARRFERLVPVGGALFLGHADTLRGIDTKFRLEHRGDAIFYHRVDPERLRREPATATIDVAPARPSATFKPPVRSRPVAAITARPAADVVERTSEAHDDLLWQEAMAALASDRFDEARVNASALSGRQARHWYLRAVLGLRRNTRSEAREAVAILLSRDDLDPVAHHLLGLSSEDPGDARQAFQRAIFLEPRFAFPHFQLGLRAHATGDLRTARRELQTAAELFGSEPAERMGLLGDGFPVETWIDVCRSRLEQDR